MLDCHSRLSYLDPLTCMMHILPLALSHPPNPIPPFRPTHFRFHHPLAPSPLLPSPFSLPSLTHLSPSSSPPLPITPHPFLFPPPPPTLRPLPSSQWMHDMHPTRFPFCDVTSIPTTTSSSPSSSSLPPLPFCCPLSVPPPS
ncbi:unnamed protein product [Closterium sp. NIES-54]